MRKRKGRLFGKETSRLVNMNWDSFLGFVVSVRDRQRVREAIRRAMVRAYKQGADDEEKRRLAEAIKEDERLRLANTNTPGPTQYV